MFQRAKLGESFVAFASDIKIEHTVFSLPFVISGVLLSGIERVTLLQCFLILGAMIFARSFAMGCNRFLDRKIDGQNIRTKSRAIPSGKLNKNSAMFWIFTSGTMFLVCAYLLRKESVGLGVLVLVLFWFYPLLKKYTYTCHLFLGFCLGMAPLGAHIALFGAWSWGLVILGCGICFWCAGFDIIYSVQDMDFDKKNRLYSIPSVMGVKKAIYISRCFFGISVISFCYCGVLFNLGVLYYAGVLLVAGLLVVEHILVLDLFHGGDSRNINVAFFQINCVVSLVFCLFVFLDKLIIIN